MRVSRTVVAAVTIGIALLVLNFVLSVSNTRQLREESGLILHSNDVLLGLDNILKLVKDAETGQRGYVITGKAEYLAPYRAAVDAMTQQLDVLGHLVEGDPVHQALLVETRRRVGAKLGELAFTIGLRERKGFELTRDVIELGAGKVEMDAISAAVAEMARHETRLLLGREAAADKTYRSALLTEVLSGLAAVAALLGFALLLGRHLAGRDRAEAAIAAQGELHRTTLASIGDAVIATDVDGRVTNLNPVAEALTGWRSGEAAGQPLDAVFRIVNESTRKPVENPATRALREGVVVGLANHTILIRKDGREAPIDDSAAPIRDAQGAVLGCVLVFRDISDRKSNEKALGAVQSRLHRIVTEMAIPTMVFAEDGTVVLVNEAWTDITGYAASELSSIDEWTQRAYGPRAAMMKTVIGAMFDQQGSMDNGEREITTASGAKRVWHFVTAPIGRDERGRRMLVTNAVDMTERRRLDAAVVASEARMRLAMEAANYGGWEWDRRSGEMIWSDKTRELLGIGADEPISFAQFQQHIHPEDRDRREKAIAAAWTSGTHANEYRVVRPDGEIRWLSSRGRVIGGADGPERMLGVIGDITEQKHLVAAFEDADRRKDEFLATLAHELRNPLAPLRNSLAILQRTHGDPAAFAKAGEVMERQLGHLVRLIDDLLDISRISLDKLTLRFEGTDLGAVVEHAVEACRPAAERAGHVIEVRQPDAPLRLRADRARLAQVFANVIGNACKFTPDGGHVSVEIRRDGDHAVVSVRDDGIGIAAEQLPAVFEMFAQADTALERTHGGLGIGLTLARRLVEMHGGSIAGRSAGLGLGSEFVVSLPMTSELPGPAPTALAVVAPAPPAGLQILVVDDNVDSAESLAMLLSLAGHETHVARDGAEALARAEALRPEAILLDLGLPGLSGYEVCRRLRAEPWARTMPIIAITGWGQADDRQRSKEAGFDGHLVKPVVFDELTSLLGECTLR